MTAPEIPICPSCSARQLVGHPAGVLEFQHDTACLLLPYEDATRAADYEFCLPGSFKRYATTAELLLIDALGMQPPPESTITVSYLTPSVRHRTWTTTTQETTP